MKTYRLLIGLLIMLLPAPAVQAETMTTQADQTSMRLTVYNQDLALVRDARSIDIPAGESVLAFKEISSRIMPETALLRGDQFHVLEQNFEFDLLSPTTLLNKYVGKPVTLARPHPKTGEEILVSATVLSTANGVVLKVGNRIETIDTPVSGRMFGRLIYPDVPDNLRERPTLTMTLNNKKEGRRPVELTYLTQGLSWKADYVARLNPAEDRLDLTAWVTLTNHSGTEFKDADLQLVAGDVNRVRSEIIRPMAVERMDMKLAATPESDVSRESLMEYHLYSVSRQTTIKNNQSKQIALLREENGRCQKRLVLQSGTSGFYWNRIGQAYRKKSVDVMLRFKNDKASNFGLPKPAGIIRVYKTDSRGYDQFVGEDRIHHTPENETVDIMLGKAFDVTADRRQTHFSMSRASEEKRRTYENEFEIKLKNGKDRPVEVTVKETIPGDWQMISQSHTHRKVDASTVSWAIQVPAKGSQDLTFRVRSKM